MPRCHLSQEFLNYLTAHRADRLTQYRDDEIPGFMLEYRPSGAGTWYFRYLDAEGQYRFFRVGSIKDIPVLEARARAYELYEVVHAGGDPKKEPRCLSAILFGDFVHRHYLPHARMKKRSWEVDVRLLRLHVLPFFAERKLDRIYSIDISNWQNAMQKADLAPASCNRVLSLLRFIFSCAIRWGILPTGKNPCQGVSAFAEHGTRERYLSAEEARRLIAALDELPTRQSALAIKLLLFTGARKSEILSARWENIDRERRQLTVPLSKSGKPRYIPLSDEALRIIAQIPQQDNVPWLFSHPKTGKPLRSLFHTWDTIRTRLGLRDVRLHDLRHSFASFLVNSGCSLYEVQRILGHYDPRVTMRYAHLAQDSLIQAANMVEKCVGKGKDDKKTCSL